MIQPTRPFRSLLLATLLCGASAAALFAQGPGGGPPPGRGPGPHHGPPPSPLFDALDTNHDGVISADEIANASASLKALLKNGATELTRDDLRPPHPPPAAPGGEQPAPAPGAADPAASPAGSPPPKAGPHGDGPDGHPHHGPPPSPLFDALDTNHDGVISADEIANASASLKALLKNGATELTRDDLRPPHPPRPPQGLDN